jgi:hypothetical protein
MRISNKILDPAIPAEAGIHSFALFQKSASKTSSAKNDGMVSEIYYAAEDSPTGSDISAAG